jgi:hypothetical protein
MSAYIKRKSDGVILFSCSTQTVENPDHLKACQGFVTSRGMSLSDFAIADADDDVVEGWLKTQDENAMTYADKRKAEYPTIAELVVALYDTDDKAAIEKRRSDVKAKYPKPE